MSEKSYKQLYEECKWMLTKYQDEVIPNLRKELEQTQAELALARGERDAVTKRMIELEAMVPGTKPAVKTKGNQLCSLGNTKLGQFLCKISDCYNGKCPGKDLCSTEKNGCVAWLQQPAEEDFV